MEGIGGSCRVRMKGESEWKVYAAGPVIRCARQLVIRDRLRRALPLRLSFRLTGGADAIFRFFSEVDMVALKNAIDTTGKKIIGRHEVSRARVPRSN